MSTGAKSRMVLHPIAGRGGVISPGMGSTNTMHWAHALAARFTLQPQNLPLLSRVLMRIRPPVSFHHHMGNTALNLSLNLNRGMSNAPTQEAGLPPDTEVSVPAMRLTQIGRQMTIEQTTRRLIERTERIERGTRTVHNALGGTETAEAELAMPGPFLTSITPPLQQVVRRGVIKEANPVMEAGPAPRPEAVKTGLTGYKAAPPAESRIDVNGLTEQVIQAIDHRIIAQRERLGRA